MTPTLSLVTGHVNRHESLERLIASIKKHTTVEWQLVIADASDEPYKTFDPRIVVIEEKPRLNCVQGYNQAFHKAKAQWIIWLNDDAEVTEGYDVAALSFMEEHPEIGIGALHYCEPEHDVPYHVNSAWGEAIYANFGIINKATGEYVGWFDTDLAMYGNDNSLAFRVLLAGRGIADIPGARIIHHSVQDHTRLENQRHKLSDNEKLIEKYWPHRDAWLGTFKRLKVDTGTVPWNGGLRPAPKVTSQFIASLAKK
jgi:GT2 family glycosyltransferase